MSVHRFIPRWLRNYFLVPVRRWVGSFFYETGNWILGQRDPMVPPAWRVFTGIGDFRSTGYKFLHYFVRYGDLRPEDDVLEMGCGMGRMPLALLDYLTSGSYHGIDIVPKGIRWCRKKIQKANPRFQFHLSDIYNREYNPHGRYTAREFILPFENGSFDFAFLTSVFTHMIPADSEHYVDELGRVLRPGGRLFSTWFLLNDRSQAAIASNPRVPQFTQAVKGSRKTLCKYPDNPEASIAYEETYVQDMLKGSGFTIHKPVIYGSWSKAEGATTMQDIIVAVRQ